MTLFNVKCVRLFSVMKVTCISDISQSNQNHTTHLLPCIVPTCGGVRDLKKKSLKITKGAFRNHFTGYDHI